jgi:hypothetical protein
MSSELYSLSIREQTGPKLLIGITDFTTTRDTKIIITRNRIGDCIRAQIDKISDDIKSEYDLCYYARSWKILGIDNLISTESLGSFIDWSTIDFTKPIASVLLTQPDPPYFKQIEFYFTIVVPDKF